MSYQNLRVRAYLQTPVISDQFLPLDGALYYHAVRDKHGPQCYALPGESNIRENSNVRLPFQRTGHTNGVWYYKCSFAVWPDDIIEDRSFYVKRFALQRSDYLDITKKRVIARKSGAYKNYHIDIYYRHAVNVDWFCRANKEEIENMLQFVTHLGKKTAHGWGAVLRWEVTEWVHDWSIRGPEGRLMRSVPVDGDGFLFGMRPSYWNDRHIFPCRMPD